MVKWKAASATFSSLRSPASHCHRVSQASFEQILPKIFFGIHCAWDDLSFCDECHHDDNYAMILVTMMVILVMMWVGWLWLPPSGQVTGRTVPTQSSEFWHFFIIFVRFTIFVILEDKQVTANYCDHFRPILNLINIDNRLYFVDTHFCCFVFLSHFVHLQTEERRKQGLNWD